MRRTFNVVTTYSSSDDEDALSDGVKSDWVSICMDELPTMRFSDYEHDPYYSDSFLLSSLMSSSDSSSAAVTTAEGLDGVAVSLWMRGGEPQPRDVPACLRSGGGGIPRSVGESGVTTPAARSDTPSTGSPLGKLLPAQAAPPSSPRADAIPVLQPASRGQTSAKGSPLPAGLQSSVASIKADPPLPLEPARLAGVPVNAPRRAFPQVAVDRASETPTGLTPVTTPRVGPAGTSNVFTTQLQCPSDTAPEAPFIAEVTLHNVHGVSPLAAVTELRPPSRKQSGTAHRRQSRSNSTMEDFVKQMMLSSRGQSTLESSAIARSPYSPRTFCSPVVSRTGATSPAFGDASADTSTRPPLQPLRSGRTTPAKSASSSPLGGTQRDVAVGLTPRGGARRGSEAEGGAHPSSFPRQRPSLNAPSPPPANPRPAYVTGDGPDKTSSLERQADVKDLPEMSPLGPASPAAGGGKGPRTLVGGAGQAESVSSASPPRAGARAIAGSSGPVPASSTNARRVTTAFCENGSGEMELSALGHSGGTSAILPTVLACAAGAEDSPSAVSGSTAHRTSGQQSNVVRRSPQRHPYSLLSALEGRESPSAHVASAGARKDHAEPRSDASPRRSASPAAEGRESQLSVLVTRSATRPGARSGNVNNTSLSSLQLVALDSSARLVGEPASDPTASASPPAVQHDDVHDFSDEETRLTVGAAAAAERSRQAQVSVTAPAPSKPAVLSQNSVTPRIVASGKSSKRGVIEATPSPEKVGKQQLGEQRLGSLHSGSSLRQSVQGEVPALLGFDQGRHRYRCRSSSLQLLARYPEAGSMLLDSGDISNTDISIHAGLINRDYLHEKRPGAARLPRKQSLRRKLTMSEVQFDQPSGARTPAAGTSPAKGQSAASGESTHGSERALQSKSDKAAFASGDTTTGLAAANVNGEGRGAAGSNVVLHGNTEDGAPVAAVDERWRDDDGDGNEFEDSYSSDSADEPDSPQQPQRQGTASPASRKKGLSGATAAPNQSGVGSQQAQGVDARGDGGTTRYEFGEPTVAGVASPVFTEGLLFMVISPTYEYALYNDTLAYTIHVTMRYTECVGATAARGVGLGAGNGVVQTSSQPRGSAQREVSVEIPPGETVIAVQGMLRNPKLEVAFSPIPRSVLPARIAENAAGITAMVARIKSKLGIWSKYMDEADVLRCCVTHGLPYVDLGFRPGHRVLCRVGVDDVFIPSLTWLQPHQFLRSGGSAPRCRLLPVGEQFCHGGVVKGRIDDGAVVAAIDAAAEYPEHLCWMFRHPRSAADGRAERRIGAYRVSLSVDGWWTSLLLDGFLPASRRGPIFALYRPDPRCQWASILEKAYAKAFGSYAAICFGDFEEHLTDLLGYPVRSFTQHLQDEAVEIVRESDHPLEEAREQSHTAYPRQKDGLFEYLGRCARRNLLCIVFTPLAPALGADGGSSGDGSTRDAPSFLPPIDAIGGARALQKTFEGRESRARGGNVVVIDGPPEPPEMAVLPAVERADKSFMGEDEARQSRRVPSRLKPVSQRHLKQVLMESVSLDAPRGSQSPSRSAVAASYLSTGTDHSLAGKASEALGSRHSSAKASFSRDSEHLHDGGGRVVDASTDPAELADLLPPDHPFIIKATRYCRATKRRLVGIKRQWQPLGADPVGEPNDPASATGERRTKAAVPSRTTTASNATKSETAVTEEPLIPNVRRTFSTLEGAGRVSSRFNLRVAAEGRAVTRPATGALALTSASAEPCTQSDGEEELLWVEWRQALKVFAGGCVSYCLTNWYHYRVQGVFHGMAPSVSLFMSVTKSVDILFTMYQEDVRLARLAAPQRPQQRGSLGSGTTGRQALPTSGALRASERRAGYPAMLLALATARTRPRGGDGDRNIHRVVARTTGDVEDPDTGSGSAWQFVRARTVTLKCTLTPEQSPYVVLPFLRDDAASQRHPHASAGPTSSSSPTASTVEHRRRPYVLEVLSDHVVSGDAVQIAFCNVDDHCGCFQLQPSFALDTTAMLAPGASPGPARVLPALVRPSGSSATVAAAAALATPATVPYQIKVHRGVVAGEGGRIIDERALTGLSFDAVADDAP